MMRDGSLLLLTAMNMSYLMISHSLIRGLKDLSSEGASIASFKMEKKTV